VRLYRYFVSQSSEFCRHNPLCCFSTNVYCCCLVRYDSVRKLLDTPSYVIRNRILHREALISFIDCMFEFCFFLNWTLCGLCLYLVSVPGGTMTRLGVSFPWSFLWSSLLRVCNCSSMTSSLVGAFTRLWNVPGILMSTGNQPVACRTTDHISSLHLLEVFPCTGSCFVVAAMIGQPSDRPWAGKPGLRFPTGRLEMVSSRSHPERFCGTPRIYPVHTWRCLLFSKREQNVKMTTHFQECVEINLHVTYRGDWGRTMHLTEIVV
jgi:hypothetical protein